MKRILTTVGIVLGILFLVLLGAGAWFFNRCPDAGPAPTLTVEKTAARLEERPSLLTMQGSFSSE